MTRPGRAAVLLAVGALLVSGCSQERETDRLPREAASSTTTDEADAVETAEEKARGRVFEYVGGRNAVLRSPAEYRTAASIGFAEEREAKELIGEAGELLEKQQKLSGEAEVTSDPAVVKTDLSPKAEQGRRANPYVTVRACVDESATHLVGADGTKVAGSEGPGPRMMEFNVINRSWPSTESWRIGWVEDLKKSC